MKGSKLFLMLTLTLVLGSCGSKKKPQDLINWVKAPEHNLSKQKQIGEIKALATYLTTDYMVANEYRKNKISQAEYQAARPNFESYHFIDLRLEVAGAPERNVQNYEVYDQASAIRREQYLSFGMQHDCNLLVGKDTVNCVMYHYEKGGDLSPNKTFLLGFPKAKAKLTEDLTLLLDLQDFHTGIIKIKFHKKDINRAPSLKISKI